MESKYANFKKSNFWDTTSLIVNDFIGLLFTMNTGFDTIIFWSGGQVGNTT